MKTHLLFFAIIISNTLFTQKQPVANQKIAVLVVGNDVGEYAN